MTKLASIAPSTTAVRNDPRGLDALRVELARLADPIPAADSVQIRETSLAGVATFDVTGLQRPRATILYVHGGAFCLVRAAPYLKMAGHLATIARSRVVVPDYRQAPEDPFPIPVLDVVVSYTALARQPGTLPLIVVGDSAGANIALAALAVAHSLGLQVPNLVALWSPWIGLTLAAQSIIRNAAADTELDPFMLAAFARAYAAGFPLDHPLISPRSFDALPLPRLLVQAGEDEILVDDARSLAGAAAEHGMNVTLEIAPGMQHNYQFWGPLVPEAMQAYRAIADRIDEIGGLA